MRFLTSSLLALLFLPHAALGSDLYGGFSADLYYDPYENFFECAGIPAYTGAATITGEFYYDSSVTGPVDAHLFNVVFDPGDSTLSPFESDSESGTYRVDGEHTLDFDISGGDLDISSQTLPYYETVWGTNFADCQIGAGQTSAIGGLAPPVPEPSTIAVDVKPNVNLKSKGVLPVSVHGTEDFMVSDIDLTTLMFGDPDLSGTVAPIRSSYEDVSGDGIEDLSLKFDVPEMVSSNAIDAFSVEAVLTGSLLDGTEIVGSDVLSIVPAKGNGKNKVKAIPEPSSAVLLLVGVFALVRRRSR